MQTQYQRWIYENRRRPFAEALRGCIIMKSEYQMMAHETVYGSQETNKRFCWGTYYANTAVGYCKICRKKHRVWQGDIYKNMSKQQRREIVKINDLCFSRLQEGHKVVESC